MSSVFPWNVGVGSRTGILIVLLLIAAGCESRSRPPLPDSTMVNLLVEFHLAEGRIEMMEYTAPGLVDSILQAYDVDSTTYHSAVDWYARHPVEYSDLYTRVLDKLTAERMEFGNPGSSAYRDTVNQERPESQPPSP